MIEYIVVPISIVTVALLGTIGRSLLHLCSTTNHLNKFSTLQTEVHILVLSQDLWIVGIGMLQSFVDVALEKSCSDTYSSLEDAMFMFSESLRCL